MKIIKLIGGLGNQMFQYAFYMGLQHYFPTDEFYFDTHFYDSFKMHNGIELSEIFNIEIPEANNSQLHELTRYTCNYKLSRLMRKFLPKLKTEIVEPNDFLFFEKVYSEGDFYYDGYWQNLNYFNFMKNDILNVFRFNDFEDKKNITVAQCIREENSVSIHIRRGDYLKSKLYRNTCELEYYIKSIEFMISKIKNACFYVFSNDIEWCKINIGPICKNHKIEYN